MWTDLFDEVTLLKGKNYYENNRISDYIKKDNIINAKVKGTNLYNVEITFLNNEINEMTCDCIASKRCNCKHLASVLYYKEFIQEEDELDNIINDLPLDILKSGLKSLLKDEQAKLLFMTKINKVSQKDILKYKDILDNILFKHSDCGYVSYHNCDVLRSELYEFINNIIYNMFENKKYDLAFELINYILKELSQVEFDIYDDYTENLILDDIKDEYTNLINKCPFEYKKEIFESFITEYILDLNYNFEDESQDILYENFTEEYFLLEKEKILLKELTSYNDENIYRNNYSLNKCIVRYLNILKELNRPKDEIEGICLKYFVFDDVKDFYIELCYVNKEYTKLISKLDEIIITNDTYNLKKYLIRKKDIYKELNDINNYKLTLLNMINDYKVYDITIYLELKSQYDNLSWMIQREKIISNINSTTFKEEIFKEEKLYDRLILEVLKDDSFYSLDKYKEVLKEEYSKEILEHYYFLLENEIKEANSRKYPYYINILLSLYDIKDGNTVALQIKSLWKSLYSKRPALMRELERVI